MTPFQVLDCFQFQVPVHPTILIFNMKFRIMNPFISGGHKQWNNHESFCQTSDTMQIFYIKIVRTDDDSLRFLQLPLHCMAKKSVIIIIFAAIVNKSIVSRRWLCAMNALTYALESQRGYQWYLRSVLNNLDQWSSTLSSISLKSLLVCNDANSSLWY